ncbi:carbon dioxide-concentrating mechanism protein CcmK [Leptothoe sp. PORK10 BA2]|uniref:carbon dioxide-concentrating mechanism protein CcmK n=1 Tax=Leptothoe sp. PORK10 BA2 TaxID=3110254 RepID=UPI002B207B73|nr:carbon dioxide-concentrating mechanism protein CcmK [Leptothoe sp. PORK10 BA2]MEA5466154.1 carbon dioxide-concentrating mechanism protein CcmK [Leptothoe sp. PORK10 BA2]
MLYAIGVIETYGYPTALAAADAMVKAGEVSLLGITQADSGHQFVTIRGRVGEVDRAMEAGIKAANDCPNSGQVMSHYTVPHPTENIESVLPLHFDENSEPFRV